jgi:hypothetical protein
VLKKEIILDVLNIPTEKDMEIYIERKGNERLAGILDGEQFNYKDLEKKVEEIDILVNDFNETFTSAGSLLADAIMLIREYYSIHGVILCGGVFQKTSGKKMLENIDTY